MSLYFEGSISVALRRGRSAMRIVVGLALAAMLTACTASIREHHHIATFGEPTATNPTGFANVLRITIKGRAGFSNVRYIAGTYDEKAVDLFLNNVKSEPYSETDGKSQGANTIFNLCVPAKMTTKDSSKASVGQGDGDGSDGGNKEAACVNGNDGNTFLIIMSTNADAIAETIGAFAENEIAVKSINYLLNRDVFDAQQVSAALASQITSERKAMLGSLEAMFTGYGGSALQSDADEIAILQTIAVALDPTGNVSFTTMQEAKEWFAKQD